ADNIADLLRKFGITADFVGPDAMRLETLGPQNVGDAAAGQPKLLTQQPRGPTASPRWRRRQRELDDLFDLLSTNSVVLATATGLIGQAIDSTPHEPVPYPRHSLGGEF